MGGRRTTAGVNGPRWGARAETWAELCAPFTAPAWTAVADATGIGEGTRVLDVACGSGEFLQLASGRGAVVSGIDAAEGMLAVACAAVPAADLRLGGMEDLPWEDGAFDVVTGFNAFQFAADTTAALAEAARVVRPGGLVAVANWGRAEEQELTAVMTAARPLLAPSQDAPPAGPAVGEPGVLKGLAHAVGLTVRRVDTVDVPFVAPDEETLLRALAAPGGSVRAAIEHAGIDPVREVIAETAAPYRQRGGSYAFSNRFTYLVAEVGARVVKTPET